MPKAAEALFEQLDKALQGPEGDEIQGKTKVQLSVILQHAFALLMPISALSLLASSRQCVPARACCLFRLTDCAVWHSGTSVCRSKVQQACLFLVVQLASLALTQAARRAS